MSKKTIDVVTGHETLVDDAIELASQMAILQERLDQKKQELREVADVEVGVGQSSIKIAGSMLNVIVKFDLTEKVVEIDSKENPLPDDLVKFFKVPETKYVLVKAAIARKLIEKYPAAKKYLEFKFSTPSVTIPTVNK